MPAGLSNAVAIAANNLDSLALKSDGTVLAWGYNSLGQTNVPGGLSNVIAMAVGSSHCLALVGGAPGSYGGQIQLNNPQRTSDGFRLSLPTESGRTYRMEYKRSLSDPDWIALPLAPGSGGTQTLLDPNPTDKQRFYRVRRW